MSKLRKLTLGGFQTIQDVVEIELAPLTLLFGPNSSGKSAIFDALKLADSLFTLPSYKRERKELHYTGHLDMTGTQFDEDNPIVKNWRRTEPLGGIESLQDRMTIGVTFDTTLTSRFSIEFEHEGFNYIDLSKFMGIKTLEVGFLSRFRFANYDENDDRYDPVLFLHRDFELTIEKEAIASFQSGDFFRFNLAHPLVNFNQDYEELLSFNLNVDPEFRVSIDENWLTFNSRGCILINDYLKLWHSIQNESFGPQTKDGVGEIVVFYNQLIEGIMRNARFLPGLVDASRRVPTEDDLSYNIKSDFDESYSKSIVESYGFSRKDNDQFRRLAFSCAMNLPDYANKQSNEADILKTVNRYLSDYLFIDRGYQLGFEYAVVMNSSQYRKMVEDLDEFYLCVYELLIKIHLLDSNGVRLDFSDVGSGLGYSLPVLIAVAEHRGSLLVQQPELHLHPALQASIADIFIDSLDKDGALIIETHSEHLILRILRRIRQSTTGSSTNDQLALSAKNVTVLYFDSLPDSSTSIKRIRVSEDGEFLDRWPHGFFEERDRELFDE